MSRKRKIFIWIAGVILVLTVLIPLLININFINNLVRNNIQSTIAHAIEGECRIEKVRMTLSELRITEFYAENESFDVRVNSFNTGISLYSLFIGRIMLNFLEIDSCYVKFHPEIKTDEHLKDSVNNENKRHVYIYPLSNLRIRVDIPSLSVNSVNVEYDTLRISNLALKASVSINKKRSALFYRLTGGDINGYTRIEPCDGELVFSEANGVGKGSINSELFKIDYDVNVHDSTLNISSLNINTEKRSLEYAGHEIAADLNIQCSGLLKGSERYISADINAKNLQFDTMRLKQMEASITLSGDTITVRKLMLKDSMLDLTATGITEIHSFPSSEFNLTINSANFSNVLRGNKLEPHDFSGSIFAKITEKDNVTLVINSLKGFYGNDSLLELKGTAAYSGKTIYFREIFCNINHGTAMISGSLGDKGVLDVSFAEFPAGIMNRIIPEELFGSLSGDIRVAGNIDNYNADYFLSLDNMSYSGSNAEHINVSGSINGKGRLVKNALLTVKAVNGSIQGNRFSIIYSEIAKKDSKLYTDLYALMDKLYIEYEGVFATNDTLTSLSGMVNNLQLRTDIETIKLEKPAYVNLSKDIIEVSGLSLASKTVEIGLDMIYSDERFSLKCSIRDDSLLTTDLFTGLLIEGGINAHITGKGTVSDPSINADMSVRRFNFEGAKIDSAFFNAEFSDSIIDVTGFSMYYRGSKSRAEGQVKINSFSDFNLNTMNARAYVEGVDSTFFAPLFDIFTLYGDGYADGYVEATGKLLNPDLQGYVNIHNAGVHIIPLGTDIRNINGSFTVSGHEVSIDTVAGETEKGKVSIKGSIELDTYNLKYFDFTINATGAQVEGIDYLYAVGDCSLRVNGTVTRPMITGTVYAREAMSNIPFMNMSTSIPSTRVDSTYINILISGDKEIWIKNNFIDVEMAGSIRIRKDGPRVNITGRANVIRGSYFYLDKRFTVTEGTFNLPETEKLVNPLINISSYTKVNYTDKGENNEANIFLNVSGPVDRPEITMYSEPSMSIDNIISILSFNTTVAGMNEITNISKTLPEKALQIYLRNKYLNALSSSMGIDQLNIETALLSENRSAKLSIGKYIGRNFFISYTHDIFTFSRDVFKIEYNFTKNGEFITERDDNGDFNAGVQFKLRY